jgi:xanthine dehydrogenase accessory factor
VTEVFAAAAALLAQGEDLVLVRVISVKGSSPRESGASMIVRHNGEIAGTIGGGLIEASAMQKAPDIFRTHGHASLAFDMTGSDLTTSAMVCGGRLEALIEYLPASKEIVDLFSSIQACRRQNQRGYLATRLPESDEGTGLLQHYLVAPGTTCATGSDGSAALVERLKDAVHEVNESTQVEIGGRRFWVDVIRNSGVVYIFGAGHISREVNDLAQRVGFSTVVLDDRQEFANRQRFSAPAELVLLESFDDCLKGLSLNGDSYVVIVTRGHVYDKTVLAQSLRTGARYIGMIGSARKKETIYKALLAEGFTQEDLKRVHCPIGLKMETETPAEIAVSIVGELINERARKRDAAG